MNDELPTLHNLKKWRPDIYKNATCLLCGKKEENTGHVFDCSALLNNRLQIWEDVKKKITSKFQEISNKRDKPDRKDRPASLLQLINQWETQFSNSSQDLINMCLGLFDKRKLQTWNTKTKDDRLKITEDQTILNLLSHKLLKLYRKKIWILRCERTIAWEQAQNINFWIKRKRKKFTRQGGIRSKTSAAHSQGSSDRLKPLEESGKNKSRSIYRSREEKQHSLGEKVKEVVWSWVKEGKKWLGY